MSYCEHTGKDEYEFMRKEYKTIVSPERVYCDEHKNHNYIEYHSSSSMHQTICLWC